MDTKSEIDRINSIISSLQKTVSQQCEKINHLNEKVKNLELENLKLKEKLNKKNSRNSSLPPSQDENRPKKNQSLRRSSGRKVGGQKGHPGDTLKMSLSPDEIVKHVPDYCNKCGKRLIEDEIFAKRRQVIDIPPIIPITTEHQVYSRKCSCGYCTVASFPNGINAPVSYGENIESQIAYFNVRQYMPVKRIQECFTQVFNLKISQASICNKLQSFAYKSLIIYNLIKNRIQTSKCVGTDETGFVLNGKKGWMWTWQTPCLTYIVASNNRSTKTITDNFNNGFPFTTLVHDCWKPHFNIPAQNHQLCLAHLRRELNYFIELKKESWSYNFERLLRKSLKLRNKILDNPDDDYKICIQQIHRDADRLLQIDIATIKKVNSFKKRKIKYRDYLFPFLDNKHIPPDNNGSERAIRNVKVKQKVSGQFKSIEGANHFAVIRSVIDTCIKNNAPIFPTLSNLYKLVPE